MNTSKHKTTILKLIAKYGKVTAAECLHISNANQYLGRLKREGVLKDEWTKKEGSPQYFKEWSIKNTPEAREKAKLYLEPCKKISKILKR
ncbi:hypothetical protein [Campylobacter concisus]|uniref:hypothetical protein n=1 Tax=Campylobacter concisus TaxID=199 RepID=UPI000CD7EE54|nr:hypothetical protein [Campylobacter concisus]